MKIREVYLRETKSYANHTPEVTDDMLDCSLGVNPYGPPEEALEAIRQFDLNRLGAYPHSHAAHDAIIEYWKNQTALTRENILLVDGSVSGIYLINQLFAKPSAEVVGFFPTFTDMIVNVEMHEMRYIGVPPTADDYSENVEKLMESICEKTALVYIDNPNNPTGQLLKKEDIMPVLEKAKELGVYVLVDEAYGDFVTREESMISELGNFSNLLVLRTFSKGFGLAGLRAGYILAAPELVSYMGKTSNPYTMNELTREAVAAAMKRVEYGASHAKDIAAMKQQIRQTVGNKLELLCTDDRVPICTLKHKDGMDLQALLCKVGVLAVSGVEFDAMDASCVRLRVPEEKDLARMLAALRKVDQGEV